MTIKDDIMTDKPAHDCPFADKISAGDTQHAEGRFSALETRVASLSDGLKDMERSVAEGFKEVFRRIESIGVARSASTIPWLMVGLSFL